MNWNWENESTGFVVLDLLLWGPLTSVPGWKRIMESWVKLSTQQVPSRVSDIIWKRGVVVSYKGFAKYFSENLQGNNPAVQKDIRNYFTFLLPWITSWKKLNWWVYHSFVTDINNLSSFAFPSKRNFNISKQWLLEVIRHMIEIDIRNTFLSSIDWYAEVVALLDAEKQKKEKWPTRTIKTPE